MLSTCTKKSKKSYYDNFFMNNLNDDLRNTWKGIGNFISITKSATSLPNTLSQNDESITETIKIANIFNNYFSTIAAKTKSKIKFSKNISLTSWKQRI